MNTQGKSEKQLWDDLISKEQAIRQKKKAFRLLKYSCMIDEDERKLYEVQKAFKDENIQRLEEYYGVVKPSVTSLAERED